MTRPVHNTALLTLLGLGAADLLALNVWAVPAALIADQSTRTQTTLLALSEAVPPAPLVTARAPERPAQAAAPSAPQLAFEIEFVKGTWWIGPRARIELEAWARAQRASATEIEVAGHADASGPDALNQSVSEQRARAVAALLIDAGLPGARIEVRGYGESRPHARGHHRRVELWLRSAR